MCSHLGTQPLEGVVEKSHAAARLHHLVGCRPQGKTHVPASGDARLEAGHQGESQAAALFKTNFSETSGREGELALMSRHQQQNTSCTSCPKQQSVDEDKEKSSESPSPLSLWAICPKSCPKILCSSAFAGHLFDKLVCSWTFKDEQGTCRFLGWVPEISASTPCPAHWELEPCTLQPNSSKEM